MADQINPTANQQEFINDEKHAAGNRHAHFGGAGSDDSSDTAVNAQRVENTTAIPASNTTGTAGNQVAEGEEIPKDERIEITEEDCYEELGFCFTERKKWTILTIIFLVQVSMNFNTSLYSNAIASKKDGGIVEAFGVSAQGARCGAMIFLVLYAFGCELWAPWSEGS